MTKASGPDGITVILLKDAAPVIAKPITYLVNLTISTGLIPAEWRDAGVTPIFKSGPKKRYQSLPTYLSSSPGVKDYGARYSSTILGFFDRT